MNTDTLQAKLSETVGGEADKINYGLQKIIDMSIEYAPKIILAILIYIIGNWLIKWLIKWIIRLLNKIFHKRHFDPSLQSFLRSIIKVSFVVLLLLTVISILGVNITSFAALLAGAGLAIGSAFNGSLGNFAGGVMIMVLKPFKLGT